MKKIIISLACVLLLCGCGRYKEINSRYLVTGIAFENTDKGVLISVNVLLPEAGENMILKGEGNNLNGALAELKKAQVKSLYFEHCATVALNQNTKNEISKILRFCKNQINIPISAQLIYCNDSYALFSADRTGYDVVTLLENSNVTSSCRLYKTEQRIADFTLPLIRAENDTITFEGDIK